MHRLTNASCLCALVLAMASACGGEQKPADDPSSKNEASEKSGTDPKAESGDGDKAEKKDSAKGEPGAAEKPAEKKDVCSGFDITNLEDLLSKSDCEVPDTRPESLQNPDVKGKLEVVVTATPAKVAPGGKVDLMVTFANKTKEPMLLQFRIDPIARFETEAYDAKKRRVDMPAGQPPPPPKGHSAPPAAEAKVAKITIAPAGFARVRVPWEAVKMKWAPEKVRGTAVERGYPRSPAGPLPRGKYSVKVMTPLVGVFEGADHEISAPKVDVEVGG